MVTSVAQASALAQTATGTAGARQTLSETYDTFLSLLTSQLRNQDPLDPVDSAEFTGQLVSYSMVEQQISTNDTLEKLIQISSANSGSALASYLGQTGEFDTASAISEGGPIEWTWANVAGATSVELSVVDSRTGQLAHRETVNPSSDPTVFGWTPPNGKAGTYTLQVSATDATGQPVQSAVRMRAPITGIDFSGTDPRLETGSGILPFEALLRVSSRL
jgi:flagellar basal-body rod modification protein FlgD